MNRQNKSTATDGNYIDLYGNHSDFESYFTGGHCTIQA